MEQTKKDFVEGATRRITSWALAVVLCLVAVSSAQATTISDDFTDGNDTANPTWTHLDGAVSSTGQTWDASGGKYRLQAPSNATHPDLFGYGFVGSRVDPLYTDVRVTVDFVDFQTGATAGWFGVAARLNGNNSPPVTGTGIALQGYSYQYEANARSGQGEVVLNVLHGGGFKDIGSQPVSLDSSKDYRFVLEITGNTLHGQVFELSTGGVLGPKVAEKIRNLDTEPVGNINHDGNAGTPEVPFVPFASGYSGTFGVGHVFLSDIDYSIDNFRSESLVSVAGDFDDDGDVDGVDLTAWKGGFGSSNAGDADDDGDTDGADFLIWQRNHTGPSAASGVAAVVPEPGVAALVMPLVFSAVCRRRKS
jgi:hypothetical protein